MILDFSSIIPAFSFILYVTFTIFGLYHKSGKSIHWPFLFYMFGMTIWGLGSFMMHANPPLFSPLFWNRFMVTGVLGVPITIFHSTLHLSGLNQKRYKILIYIGYGIYSFLLVLNFLGLIVTNAGFENQQFYYTLGKGAVAAYSLSYLFLLLGIYILAKELKKTNDPLLRKKIKPVLYGACVLLAGYLVNLYEPLGRYPIDLFAATINAIFIFIAIYKYRLVSYSRAVLRIILYLILIVISSFVFYGIIWLTFVFLEKARLEYTFLISLLLGIVASVIFQPLRRGTMTMVEKIYMGKRLPYLNSLRAFSYSLTSITDLSHLGKTTVEKIVDTFNLEWALIIGLDYTTRNYRMLAQRGLDIGENETAQYVLPGDSDFVQRTLKKKDVVLQQNGTSHVAVEFPARGLTLSPSLILPLVFKERVNGCILLRKDLDKELFNQYEIEALEILAGQCSVSLENAISFERLKRQQKRLQDLNNELIISRNKLEAFFDGITNPISIQDINYNIVSVNFAVSKYFNRPFEELIGKKCYRVFFNLDKPCKHCMAQDCLHTSLPFNTEIIYPETNVVFSIQFYPVQMPAGSDKLILEFFQDITHQKRLQEELVRSEKLAGIGTLASGIAHEINNPLGGILGTAEIMLDEVEDNEKLKEYTTDIIKYSETAAEIIKDLTNYSRMQDNRPQQINISEVLENSLVLAKRGMSFENITVRKQYEELPLMEADPNELQQVFLNILINAVQAMIMGGTLTIICEKRLGNAYISIQDTGHGIPQENMENIFNPFFTTKDPGQGTGLGLSITHQIIYNMGGRIDVRSSPGEGSTFEIYLPLNEKERKRIRFVHATSERMKEDVFYLQRKILVGEKGYIEETIHRTEDIKAYHIVAYKGLQPVGTVSCLSEEMVKQLPIEWHFGLKDFKEDKRCVEIDRLAVLKEERGSIIPLGLMTLAYLYAKAKNAERIFFDVFTDDKKHIAMYRKLGFQEIGTYASPLPVTVMMLDHKTDYERKTQRMEHFVKPFMERLKQYLEFSDEEKSIFLVSMEKIVEKTASENR